MLEVYGGSMYGGSVWWKCMVEVYGGEFVWWGVCMVGAEFGSLGALKLGLGIT